MHLPQIARREPAINLPAPLLGAIAALVGIHAARSFLSEVTDLGVAIDYGFLPGRWSLAFGLATLDDLVRTASSGLTDPRSAALMSAFAEYVATQPGPHAWSFLTYAALHGSWPHVLLNCVWLAAFGAPVLRRLGGARMTVLAVATALGGAAAYWLANRWSVQPMIGASAVVSGFMGAAALFAFDGLGGEGRGRGGARALGLAGLFRNRTAMLFLGSWFAINLLLGLAAGPLGLVEGGIAWEAHLGGLLTGLLLFPLLDRERPGSPGTLHA
jgi:membrane associated rhomboid family serine protease